MSAKAIVDFHALDPDTHTARFFEVGDKVPARIAAIARDAVDKPPPLDNDTEEVTLTRAELDQQIRSAVVQAFTDAGLEPPEDPRDADDDTNGDGEGDSPFDPEAHSADEVNAHLKAQDPETEDGQAEIDRVTALEKAGKDRKTAYLG